MGVIHKLKQELIDFIIGQKKENPQLGCRKLASLASEKFQAEVSKSSVNAVIKSASLSSPLGRKPRSEIREKKFKIPSERKEQIFPALKPDVPPPLEPVLILRRPARRAAQHNNPEQAPEFSLGRVEGLTRKMVDHGVFFDGMGSFFLKAAEWELNPPSILGALLSKHINKSSFFDPSTSLRVNPEQAASFSPGRVERVDVNTIGQVLLFLEPFGIQVLEDLRKYGGRGLWALNGLSQPLDYDILRKAIDSIDNIHAFLLRVSSEKVPIFSEINYFKLALENRMEFCVDSRFNTIWSCNVHSGITAPTNKVMTVLSSQLINNVQPIILRTAPGEERISAQFYEMLGAFENIPGKRIAQITLFDSRNEEFAQFNILPDKKRTFMTGLRPSQGEFLALAKQDSGKVNSFVLNEWDKEIYYSELIAALPYEELIGKPLSLRIFFLRESAQGMPRMAVLTNIPDGESSPEQIISEYVLHWPYFEQGWQELKERYGTAYEGTNLKKVGGFLSEGSNLGDSYDFLEGIADVYSCVRALLYDLDRYGQKHFYPTHYEKLDFSVIKSRFYGLPGYLRKVKNVLFVHLTPPSDYLYWEDLEFAIRRVNESAVTNAAGLRLLLSSDPRF